MGRRYKIGEAPWETEEASTPKRYKIGEAPWETEEAYEPEFLDVKAEDIAWKDRTVAKNFIDDPTATINFYQKKYPDKEFVSKDNGVFTRDRGAGGDYKAIDPSSWEMADVSDVGYDILSGIAETAGMVGGGVAGAAAGGGVGAIPGAMAGSAAMSGLAETGRQAIGREYFDSGEEYNPELIGLSTLIGGAGPLIGGTGGTVTKAMAKQAAKGGAKNAMAKSMQKVAASPVAQDWLEKGVMGKGIEGLSHIAKGAVGKTSGVLSGIRGKHLKDAVEKESYLNNLKSTDSVVAAVHTEMTKLKNNISKTKDKLWNDMRDRIAVKGDPINIDPAIKEIDDMLFNIEKKPQEEWLDFEKETYDQLSSLKDELFSTQGSQSNVLSGLVDEFGAPLIPETQGRQMIKGDVAPDLGFRLKDGIRNRLNTNTIVNQNGEESVKNTILDSTLKKVNKSLNEQFESAYPDEFANNALYAKVKKDETFFRKNFMDNAKSPFATYEKKGVKGLFKSQGSSWDGSLNRDFLKNSDLDYGTKLEELSDLLVARNVRDQASWVHKSIDGATSTSRTKLGASLGIGLGLAAGSQTGADPALGYGVGGAVGALATSPRAFLKYMQMAQKTGRPTMVKGLPVARSAWQEMAKESQRGN